MRTWQLPVNKKRQQATHAPSETDENLRHVVSPASRPGVFQIALFKGFPDIPHIPLPPEHSVGKNEATRSPTRENPQSWKEQDRPREICTPGRACVKRLLTCMLHHQAKMHSPRWGTLKSVPQYSWQTVSAHNVEWVLVVTIVVVTMQVYHPRPSHERCLVCSAEVHWFPSEDSPTFTLSDASPQCNSPTSALLAAMPLPGLCRSTEQLRMLKSLQRHCPSCKHLRLQRRSTSWSASRHPTRGSQVHCCPDQPAGPRLDAVCSALGVGWASGRHHMADSTELALAFGPPSSSRHGRGILTATAE